MLAGQYVVHDGKMMQVSAIQTTAASGLNGMPIPATSYRLVDLQALRYVFVLQVHGQPGVDLELAPGCEPCGRAAGFSRCAFDGTHQGPPAKLAPYVVRGPRPVGCSCYRWDCGPCGEWIRAGLQRGA